jgi:hypothetical protein
MSGSNISTEATVWPPPHIVEERKELKRRHALIRRRLNKLLRHQVLGTCADRSELNPLERAQHDEATIRVERRVRNIEELLGI